MTTPAPAVRCQSLRKRYGAGETSAAALRGVDLEVGHGELLMLVGPSGCGKTTLLSVIGAILEPDEGMCEVLGQDVRTMDASRKARFRGASIGFVFQSFNLLPSLSAADNVGVPLLLNGASYATATRRAHDVLASLGLATKADEYPNRLSGGQQQRVAIARALVHEPKLILCDEPTSNLDAQTGHETMVLLRETVRTPERAVLVVTHDSRILGFADRIARMEDGHILDVLPGSAGGHA